MKLLNLLDQTCSQLREAKYPNHPYHPDQTRANRTWGPHEAPPVICLMHEYDLGCRWTD